MENVFDGLLDEELVEDDVSNSTGEEINLIQVMAGIVGLSEIISVLSTKIDTLIDNKTEAVEVKEEVVETTEELKEEVE